MVDDNLQSQTSSDKAALERNCRFKVGAAFHYLLPPPLGDL